MGRKYCFEHNHTLDGSGECLECKQDAALKKAEYILKAAQAGEMPPDTESGVKADANKPRWSLLPLPAVKEVIGVLEFGAKKYDVDNWQKVPDARTRYYDAAMRHLTAWREGERNDPESGLHHLAHAGCCVLFLLWFEVKVK